MHWYIQVQNQVYGPYDDGQMQGFVSEGRVNGNSMVANQPGDGFYAAQGYDVFGLWSGTGQAVAAGGGMAGSYYEQAAPTQVQPQTQPQTQIPAAAAETIAPETQAGAQTSVFVIMAEIRSDGAMGFLKALQSFGQAQRIGDTVWLLKSAHSVQQLRNTLSQSLDRQDRLFILDSSANKTAWFNIGADLDGRIRELWNEDDD